MNRLGTRLHALRGERSLVAFSRALGLSYTFVREMERGNRLPSDDVILRLAERLHVEPGELALLTYCDRSELLARHLGALGIEASKPVPPPVLPKLETGEFSPALSADNRGGATHA